MNFKEDGEYEFQFNFITVGDSGVGKSCFVLNFAEQRTRRLHQPTIACEFAARVIQVKGRPIRIQIWDTAGQENFRSITRSYYRNSVAALIVYDITNRSSFDKVASWISEVKENVHKQVSVYLIGNKLDLESQRQVQYEEGQNLAKQHNIKFTETCAFELSQVEPIFISLAEETLAKIDSKVLDCTNEQMGIKLGKLSQKGKGGSKYTPKQGQEDGKKKCCSSN